MIWQKQVWGMGYGLWIQNPCKPTWEMEKPMGYTWYVLGGS